MQNLPNFGNILLLVAVLKYRLKLRMTCQRRVTLRLPADLASRPKPKGLTPTEHSNWYFCN